MPEWLGGGEWAPNITPLELIPLAEGGIVTSPTTALIGEAGPEAVIPLAEFSNMLSPLYEALQIIAQATTATAQILQVVGEAILQLGASVIGGAIGGMFGGGGEDISGALIKQFEVMNQALTYVVEATKLIIQSLSAVLPISVAADQAAIEYFKASMPNSGVSQEENSSITNRMDTLIQGIVIIAEANIKMLENNTKYHEAMMESFPKLVDLNKEQTEILDELKDKKAIVELDGNKVGEVLASTFSGLF
jgi:hypothetical protein